MLEQVLIYERDAFLWLNGGHTAFWDHVMWLYSGKAVWLPLAAFMVAMLVYKKSWKESLLILLAIALTITLCDQFASHVCKPLFTRFRPTHHPDFMEQVKIVFDYRGGKYGFISSHAANAFGFATFMSLLFRHKLFSVTIFLWALVTAYSRIYLGVHFISDIVPGMVSGSLFGWLVYRIYEKVRWQCIPESRRLASHRLYTFRTKQTIVAAIWLTFLLLLLFNKPLVMWLR